MVIDAYASIVPLKTLLVPRVAELPIAQKIFCDWAPLASTILAPDDVVSVEAIWKMNTALALPCASRVKVPVIASDDVDLYSPGASVSPPKSPDVVMGQSVSPWASL